MNIARCCTIVGVALVIATAAAEADDQSWTNPAGGLFGDETNWNGGAGPVPGIGDAAIFDLDAAFTVDFAADRITDRVIVRRGDVTLASDDDPFDYTLLGPIASAPSIAVAEDDVALLALGAGIRLRGQGAAVGIGAGATGTLALDGAVLRLDQQLQLGLEGEASLTATGSASIEDQGALLGLLTGSVATATLSGAGTAWDSAGALIVGEKGTATLTIEDGADVTSNGAVVGLQPGALGDVSVSGLGSSWLVFDSIDIGMRGTGTVTLDGGASLFNLGFATLGSFPTEVGEGGLGIVRVEGSGTSWSVQGDLWIGFLASGTLILSRGGHVAADGNVFRSATGATSRLIIEIGAADDYTAPALVSGGFTDDFEPQVKLVDGYVPTAGDRFEIVRAGLGPGALAFDLPAVPEGLAWHLLVDAESVALEVATPCVAFDIDGSGQVDFGDVLAVLASWGECPGCAVDIDFSGAADFGDVLLILSNWGVCP